MSSTIWVISFIQGERVCNQCFLSYLPGFVYCFAGYWIAFRHVSVLDLFCFGAGFYRRGLFMAGLVALPPPLL